MLPTIEKCALESVTGGRYQTIQDSDPQLLQAMTDMGKSLEAAAKTKAGQQAQHDQMFAQLLQPYLEDMLGGKGKGGGKKPSGGGGRSRMA